MWVVLAPQSRMRHDGVAALRGYRMNSQAPGMLWIYFQNAILVAIPASYLVLRWYRTQVARTMASGSGAATAGDDRAASQAAGLDTFAPAVPVATMSATVDSETRARCRLAVVYLAAGVVAAAVSAVFFLSDFDDRITPLRAFTTWYSYGWLLVPTLAALLAVPQRRALLWMLAYLLIGAAAVAAWSAFEKFGLGRADARPAGNAIALLQFVALQAWLPYLIILATGNRVLRSVSTLVLAGLLVFSYSALLLHYVVIASLDVRSLGRGLLAVAGANFPRLLYFILALPVGLVCWSGLRWLARRFEAKAFSDVQLAVDAWWLIAVFNYAVELSSDRGWAALLGLLAFAAYRTAVELGLKAWPATNLGTGNGRRLLLLRVFGFRRRSEALFDAIAQRWRFLGSVRVIAGTDLVGRTIDPGDLIGFLGGRLKRQFVRDGADLADKLARLDEARDPDGRFRINEFFCFDDTWQATLRALLQRSDLVLMDLRGFSQHSRGCRFELEQVMATGLLGRTLFVVDDTTDQPLLQASLSTDSIVQPPSLRIAPARKGGPAESEAILESLRNLVAAA
jgi:hypothetical protein